MRFENCLITADCSVEISRLVQLCCTSEGAFNIGHVGLTKNRRRLRKYYTGKKRKHHFYKLPPPILVCHLLLPGQSQGLRKVYILCEVYNRMLFDFQARGLVAGEYITLINRAKIDTATRTSETSRI